MSSAVAFSIHFLGPAFHGCRDGGEPEWPPSPLRALQSLVSAAASEPGDGQLPKRAGSALRWLERHGPPSIIAPRVVTGSGYRLSVPNNAMDVVARAWSRGNDSNSGDANPATHRTMKAVLPTWMIDGDTVHYLWPLPEPITEEIRGHVDALRIVARNVVALGWGIDMVVANAAVVSDQDAARLAGEQWTPAVGEATTNPLRVPKEGTLSDLERRHERFLHRLQEDEHGRTTFAAPPPLTVFDVVGYRRAIDPPIRDVAAFALLQTDGTRFREFDTARRALTVAGMIRHVAKVAATASGRPEEWIARFVLGHAEPVGALEHKPVGVDRFAYLPIPSIEGRGAGKAKHVGSVRRVVLTCMGPGHRDEVAWAERALSGRDLVEENRTEPTALLRTLPASDRVLQHYLAPASTWATVTPVVLPGFDDPDHYRRRLKKGVSVDEQKRLLGRLSERTDTLLRKAICQAGLSETMAQHALVEWHKVGFWPGTSLADSYVVPDHLKRFPRVHVKVTWRDASGQPLDLAGPLCLGGGRFLGLGLFAALDKT